MTGVVSLRQSIDPCQIKDLEALHLGSHSSAPSSANAFSMRRTSAASNPVCCLIDTNEREANWIAKERKRSAGANFPP